MSGNKYADLPDIDTAPDVYETEDIFPSSQVSNADTSDDEAAQPLRSVPRGRNDISGREEIDLSSLIDPEEASKLFRKAEKKHDRLRTHYAYPSSPSSPTGISKSSRPVPLSHRLRTLQIELASLEAELADPSNPLLHKDEEDEHVDPGELIRGLVDVRGRLEKIRKGKEGRGRLVGVVLGEGGGLGREDANETTKDSGKNGAEEKVEKGVKTEVRSIVDMDRRVGELEKLVGSSSAALDETSPLPPPLLPLVTRLNAQLTLLTQPRHIDSISRRLKLLLSDLDRASAHHHPHRRHSSQTISSAQTTHIQEQIVPFLSRLGPSLSHIPHILTRLRTLSTLHASAAEFHGTLEGLEQEQQKMREALTELERAVATVEKSLEDNRTVVKGNVAGLESRVDSVLGRLEELSTMGRS